MDYNKYVSCSQWSAVEVWQDYNRDFAQNYEVDVYSLGMLLWEIETECVPFEGVALDEVRDMILKQRLRPLIPKETQNELATLIRRCWQDKEMFRPSVQKVLGYLKKVTFSTSQ